MVGKSEKHCHVCEETLDKNAVGLNKKLFEYDAKRNIYRCLPCMAEYLECSVDELLEKVEEFKAEGCKLFQ